MKPIPSKIEPHGSNDPREKTHISLAWNTGETFSLPYVDLRFACPCAYCVDEMTGKRTLQKSSIQKDIQVQKIELVGRYAVKIHWSDRHKTGIYPFPKLHQICKASGKKITGESHAQTE